MLTTKVCQGLRPALLDALSLPPSFFFIFFFPETENRTERRLPRSRLQMQYLTTAGALEVMSTNRCCREMFLLLNCSKHVSVFLALGMFWCAHKLYRRDLGLGRVGERSSSSVTAGHCWSRAEPGTAARVHSPGHTGSEREGGKKTHSRPYLLPAQEHGGHAVEVGAHGGM